MDTLELKNHIIRTIESLNDEDFEEVVQQLLEVLKLGNIYKLSLEKNEAIDQPLILREAEELMYSHDEVMGDDKDKYPNLDFNPMNH